MEKIPDDRNSDKTSRILSIYTRLLNGELIRTNDEVDHYAVNRRSILRDINDIRCFLDEEGEKQGYINTVIYDQERKGYRLEQIYRIKFTNAEILAICKILIDSRAFRKKDMSAVLDKLIMGCVPSENQKLVKTMIRNEEFHYIELQHKKPFLDTLWQIAKAIRECRIIEVTYQRLKGKKSVFRRLQPVGIIFSEFYFYLTAFIDDKEVREGFDVLNDSFPTIYRIDRIQEITITEDGFHIPYASRFEEGEFRKRIQFMYGGKLRKVRFKYKGLSIESVLDRLPTAKILEEYEDAYLVEAEVFGDGIDMWLRSQGDMVETLP